jgi:hypothetical protein
MTVMHFLMPAHTAKGPAAKADEDLERLRALALEADRGEGTSLRGLSREERRKVMLGR